MIYGRLREMSWGRWRLTARVLVLACAAVAIAGGQTATPIAFEVASVKATKVDGSTPRTFPGFLPGGRFVSRGIPLRFVIAAAWNVGGRSVRLSGGPAWVNSVENVYDIEAKAPQGSLPAGLPSNVRYQRMRQMLQSLLEERFKLKIRSENKELSVYAVVVGKNGPKLEKAGLEEKDCSETAEAGTACHMVLGGQGRGLHGKAVSVPDILGFVENWTDRPLVDKTGLQRLFKVDTRGWRDIQPGPEPAAGAKGEDGSDLGDIPTLFTMFEQLGLRLVSQKGTVEVFVIERVERPSEN